jgi:tRNA threonylcarbamoyladenosine biosynthesis protein TsaE
MVATWEAILSGEQATRQLGVRLGQLLPANTILLLNGDLGSGKTTVVQGIGEGLGIGEPIVSPTFTLICEYPEGRIPLYHFDLYRLQPQEVEELYLEAYWEGTDYPLGIVAIEWAERLLHPPSDHLKICLKVAGDGRQVQLQATGPYHQQQLQQIAAEFQPA